MIYNRVFITLQSYYNYNHMQFVTLLCHNLSSAGDIMIIDAFNSIQIAKSLQLLSTITWN